MKNEPVAWIKEGTLMYLGNYNYASIAIQVQKSNSVGFDIPLYTQDQLEEARKLGMQQERAMWELAASTQEIMDTHPVKELHLSLQKDKETGELLAVTYTDDEHRIVEVLWQRPPVKEFFEDEPQAEELHEIMQSNAELTDEEILKLEEIEFDNYCVDKESKGRKTATITDPEWAIWFARAILRKASEK